MNVVPPTEAGIGEAADAVRNGGVVAYPTETVYGLAVDPFSPVALERLFAVKGRDPNNPILLLVSDDLSLQRVVSGVSARAAYLMRMFWPGPLSLVLPAQPGLHPALLGRDGKVCLRRSSCAAAQTLCAAAGGVITSTSANRSGSPAALALSDMLLDDVAVGIDGGRLAAGPPSTVYDPDEGRVLRCGALDEGAIRDALNALEE